VNHSSTNSDHSFLRQVLACGSQILLIFELLLFNHPFFPEIDFYNYEESYYNIIEDLIYLKYGDEVGALILWYVYDRFDSEGNLQKLEVTIPGKTKKIFTLKSALDLWDLIEKINKANKNSNL
jgi:hypothetical protein